MSPGILQLKLTRLPGPLCVGLVLSERGLCRVVLETSRDRVVDAMRSLPAATPPSDALLRELMKRFGAYQRGEHDALRDVSVDLSGRSAFQRSVLTCVREIRFGEVMTYGELARQMGRP